MYEKDKRLGEKAKVIEDQVKDLVSIKNNHQVRVNMLEIKKRRYKLLKTKEKTLEEREKQFIEQVKVHERQMKYLESNEEQFVQ